MAAVVESCAVASGETTSCNPDPMLLTKSRTDVPAVSGIVERTSRVASGNARRTEPSSSSAKTTASITCPGIKAGAFEPNWLRSPSADETLLISKGLSWVVGPILIYSAAVNGMLIGCVPGHADPIFDPANDGHRSRATGARSRSLGGGRRQLGQSAGFTPIHALEQDRRGLHFGEAKSTAVERHLIASPQFHVPILVDMGGTPSLIDVEAPPQDCECQQRGASQRRDGVHGAKPPGIHRDRGTRLPQRSVGLRNEHHAARDDERGAEHVARPCDDGIP